MSDQIPSFDAYSPPAENNFVVPPQKTLTAGIKAIAIISIILGAMGAMSVLAACVSLALGSQLQQMFAVPPPAQQQGELQRMQELQDEMTAKANALTQRYMPFLIGRLVIHFPLAIALLVGGITTLTGSVGGRKMLRIACGFGIPFELARAVLDTITQLENAAIMRPYLEQMLEGPGNAGEAAPMEAMSSVLQVAFMAGLIFGLLMVIAKVVFYVISFIKLRIPTDASAATFPDASAMR